MSDAKALPQLGRCRQQKFVAGMAAGKDKMCRQSIFRRAQGPDMQIVHGRQRREDSRYRRHRQRIDCTSTALTDIACKVDTPRPQTRRVFFPCCSPGEDRAEFEKKHRRLIAEYSISGPLEHHYALVFARLIWRAKICHPLRLPRLLANLHLRQKT